jgi:hypothetical protein
MKSLLIGVATSIFLSFGAQAQNVVPAPPPVYAAPTYTASGSAIEHHAIWFMTCLGADGATYEVTWNAHLHQLLIRGTGKTYVAHYSGQAMPISPTAFSVSAYRYDRELLAIFSGPDSSMHIDPNAYGSGERTEHCWVTGGID